MSKEKNGKNELFAKKKQKNEKVTEKKPGIRIGSIRGRIFCMGVVAIVSAVVIANVGLKGIGRNSKYSQIDQITSDLNLLQAENQELDVRYQYYLDNANLEQIISNLNSMNAQVDYLQKVTDSDYSKYVNELRNNINEATSNYQTILECSEKRGYQDSQSMYAQYLEKSAEFYGQSSILLDNKDWIEIPWTAGRLGETGEQVTVDGKEYFRIDYNKPFPTNSKRDRLAFRIGGTLEYEGDIFITDIHFTKGGDRVDVSLPDVNDVSHSGFTYVDHDITTFDGKPAIRVGTKFEVNGEDWTEFSVEVPVAQFNPEKYENIQYSMYYSADAVTAPYSFQYGGAYVGIYPFAANMTEVDRMFSTYTALVVEGGEVTELYTQLEGLLTDIVTNVPLYTSLQDNAAEVVAIIEQKIALLQEMNAIDNEVLALKAANVQLSQAISEICSGVHELSTEKIAMVKSSSSMISIVVLLVSAMIMCLITTNTAISIRKSIQAFQRSLIDIESGMIYQRVEVNGKNEFSEFGKSINSFLERLTTIVAKLKEVSHTLSAEGENVGQQSENAESASQIVNSALNDISHGAAEQANDIENSTLEVQTMKENMLKIIDSVENLSANSDGMAVSGNEARKIIDELGEITEKTTDAVLHITDQIKATDSSVAKIQEVINLIADIASQTNLLSLNASIEAARAGEAGRGFAVVASEIQHLADQTNKSADVITEIIQTLSAESQATVQSITDVTEVITHQKDKLEETRGIVLSVEQGIKATIEGMRMVQGQADICRKSGDQVGDLMTNLSAVAEENSAATEHTTASMGQLRDTTETLAQSAQQLVDLSNEVIEDLSYFKLEKTGE